MFSYVDRALEYLYLHSSRMVCIKAIDKSIPSKTTTFLTEYFIFEKIYLPKLWMK